MLRQDELAFIKALSTLQRKLATARKKVPTVSAGRRSTTTGSGSRASQQLAGQEKSQRASQLERLYGASQPGPSNWRWVHASARDNYSHRRTSCCQQPATRNIRVRGNVRGFYWPLTLHRLSQVGRSSPQPWIRNLKNPVSRWRHPTGACLTTCPGP